MAGGGGYIGDSPLNCNILIKSQIGPLLTLKGFLRLFVLDSDVVDENLLKLFHGEHDEHDLLTEQVGDVKKK